MVGTLWLGMVYSWWYYYFYSHYTFELMIHEVWFPLIIVVLFSLIEGLQHGYYYTWKWLFRKSYHQVWMEILKDEKKEINVSMLMQIKHEHIFFTLQRGVLTAALFFLIPLPETFGRFCLSAITWIAICACVYSLPHNSVYFIVRNKLVPWIYPHAWKTNEVETNSAMINLSLFMRIFLFVLGIAGAILYQNACYFCLTK